MDEITFERFTHRIKAAACDFSAKGWGNLASPQPATKFANLNPPLDDQ